MKNWREPDMKIHKNEYVMPARVAKKCYKDPFKKRFEA